MKNENSLECILDSAEEEFIDMVEQGEVTEHNCTEVIFELADSNTPIYTGDLLETAISSYDLAVTEPEVFAFDGEHTAVNAIAGNIYEELIQHLHDVWYRLEEDRLEREAQEEEDEEDEEDDYEEEEEE